MKGKDLVMQILSGMVNQQLNAILGGIVGGKEEDKLARKDLKMYQRAFKYAKKNLK